ncbi:NEDD4 family-interacting protein 1 isoform X1 [Trichogramma pretiosum]|uniref:NEDD4 family-interacting protein 1 isoform X1 n=1 Tax=Trichogramma pretiosum TaxID=7493 RepID=UPI0006C98882|nr:NEDD4 family-interacting protein 1 isoform X1 [Trichogramma pretiosum]
MSQHTPATTDTSAAEEGAMSLPVAHPTCSTTDRQANSSVNMDHNNEVAQEPQIPASRTQNVVINISEATEEIPPPKPDYSAPPPYEVVTKLPSYEEVQREKTLQGEPIPTTILPQVHIPSSVRPSQQPLAILAIDTDGVDGDPESGMLGTDFMFFTAFLVAFLFNWIGFLLLMCFCHTIASRYGALSGFGLSLTKWTLIVKHSTDLASRENSWLWWLIMAFGILICVRAIIQYLNIKRGWRLLSGSAQERLLFYY